LFLFHLSDQFGHGRVEGGRQTLHDQNGGHALAPFQQTDVVTVQVGLSGESFLRETSGLASAAKGA
jgi:hypothetical protein